MTAVVCPECRHENESERVYCHGCGARLDRAAARVVKGDVDDARKRVAQLFDPNRARMRTLFFKISKVLLGALILAGLVEMALPPDLPAPPTGLMQASQVGLDLERATSRHQPAQLGYSEDQINAFLASSLKSRKKMLDEPLLDFKRAFVRFREGAGALTMERSLFGYSLFTTLDMSPAIAGDKFNVIIRGGSVGRLPIHPSVAKFMGLLFGDLSSALEREKKLLAKMGTIEFHDQRVMLTVAP